jgi:hypothetical protein
MTGPEHYAAAEDYLAAAIAIETDGHDDSMSAWNQRQAQAHATLALAATQVDGAVMHPADRHEWMKATDPDYAARRAEDIAWLAHKDVAP